MTTSNKFIAIEVRITTTDGFWTCTRGLPTFFLHPNIQGITDEGISTYEKGEARLRPIVEALVNPNKQKMEVHFTWAEAD